MVVYLMKVKSKLFKIDGLSNICIFKRIAITLIRINRLEGFESYKRRKLITLLTSFKLLWLRSSTYSNSYMFSGCSASGLQIAQLSSCRAELGDISFKADRGTTLRALNPGVSVNLATENEGRRVLGKEGARWDFACSTR
ncbi:hypothetical protein AVEN_215178-1 [Araneus ventricosus]|uniref:Uncharacterized protein n=1 Tax=Araneus ventricosus TaxID=182803 RepID=A0A4Y2FPF2_ARAVE|nr:hypothetical protein AVEN_215178-1 [Araneus ventricosus]